MNRCVIVYGSPFDGMQVVGPFEDYEDATSFAEENIGGLDWWAVELGDPSLLLGPNTNGV